VTTPVAWRPREGEPLAPVAFFAEGAAAWSAAERLLAEARSDRRGLASAPGSSPWLFVTGDELPWVDQVRWVGLDPSARGLFLPTTLVPAVPVPLLAEAVRRRVGLPALALPGRVVDLRALAPVQPHRLAAWRGVAP